MSLTLLKKNILSVCTLEASVFMLNYWTGICFQVNFDILIMLVGPPLKICLSMSKKEY